MAFATAKTKTVTEVTGVDLSLTKAEAETLVAVLRAVGGDRYNGPRTYTDAILTQLTQVAKVRPADVSLSGTIMINTYSVAKSSIFDSINAAQVKW